MPGPPGVYETLRDSAAMLLEVHPTITEPDLRGILRARLCRFASEFQKHLD